MPLFFKKTYRKRGGACVVELDGATVFKGSRTKCLNYLNSQSVAAHLSFKPSSKFTVKTVKGGLIIARKP